MTGASIASLVKRNGWAINLLFILIGAYLIAGAANSVVARSIRVVPTVDNIVVNSQSPAPNRSARNITYVAMAARNLFGAQRENLSPVQQTAVDETLVAGGDFDPNDLRKCTVSASLRATLVADGAPEWSMAVIYNNPTRETGVYSINEGSNVISADATLVHIGSREIVVRRRDHFERCLCEGEGGVPSRPSRAGKAPKAVSTDRSAGVSKTGANEWEVSRDYLNREVLENLSKVATQARIVPSFKNGKPNGFKLFSIKPGSIYSKIGMQNGDVIQKINGYEMNSPDKALEIYQKLKESSSITLDLQRRGQSMTFNYGIR